MIKDNDFAIVELVDKRGCSIEELCLEFSQIAYANVIEYKGVTYVYNPNRQRSFRDARSRFAFQETTIRKID